MSATNWRWRYSNELLLSTDFADLIGEKVLMGSRDAWDDSSKMMEGVLEEAMKEDPEIPLLKPWQQVALTGVYRVNLYLTNDICLGGGKIFWICEQ
jgi:hypothetical protein